MKLSAGESDHVNIGFDDAREAKVLLPAFYGEVNPRSKREELNDEINSGLLKIRLGREHEPISVTLPLTRVQPVAKYLLVMFERHQRPFAINALAMAYDEMFMIADEVEKADNQQLESAQVIEMAARKSVKIHLAKPLEPSYT